VVRLETAPVSLLCLSLQLSSSMVKLGTTSPSLHCHAAVGGGHHAAVGDGLFCFRESPESHLDGPMEPS